jgi:hypothetical protein
VKYGKPVLVDEYGYEGNNMMPWGSLTGRLETSRHWGVTMAGGYTSHGETYVHPGDILWWAVGGELVGESPARLRFLKQILSETPYQELPPLPDAVKGGTALGKKANSISAILQSLAIARNLKSGSKGQRLSASICSICG